MDELIERARKEEALLNGYYRMPKAAAVMSELIAALEAARGDMERAKASKSLAQQPAAVDGVCAHDFTQCCDMSLAQTFELVCRKCGASA